MKKVLAIIICVCIALTISVSAFAASSPQNKVIIRKGFGTKQDGSSIPVDTYAEVADNNTITIVADEKTYGSFDNWSFYVIKSDGTYALAQPGVDYTVKEGSTSDKKMVIAPINQIIVAGNYNGTITDPLSASTVEGTKKNKSVKTGDVNVMYAVIVMLAAGAVLFGVKRQLSK